MPYTNLILKCRMVNLVLLTNYNKKSSIELDFEFIREVSGAETL